MSVDILQLAASHFHQDIGPAEQRLFETAASGKDADCTNLGERDRIIRADRLSWLCTNREAYPQVTHRGLSIIGAQIEKKVDLEWATISFPITASKCIFKDGIILNHGHFFFFGLLDGSVSCLEAKSSHFEEGVVLNHIKAEGGVDLEGAKIEGNLEIHGGEFIGNDQVLALNANAIQVKGSVYLRNGFKTKGQANFVAAKIGGNFDCEGAEFVSNGEISALKANSAKIEGSVFWREVRAEGGANLVAAKIEGYLDCDGGDFIGKDETLALDVNGIEVKKNVSLNNGKFHGGADVVTAKIGGNLECELAEFVGNDKAPALDANSAQVKGNVFLRKVKAEGEVNLVGAEINGHLICDGGQLVSTYKKPALDASSARIDGRVSLGSGTIVEGEVRLVDAKVGRSFQWRGIKSPEQSILDLRFGKVGTLRIDQNSLPMAGKLRVDGLVYDQIDDKAPPSAKAQLGWLGRQPQDRFLSQPYEQLAAVLGEMGLEEEARKVMIAKNKNQAAHLHWRPAWLWYGLFGKLVGYGYRPWRAFLISLVVIGIGWLVFDYGFNHDLVTPPEEKAYKTGTHELTELYPRFNAFVYSLETFVPLLKLGISQYWMPNATRPPLLVIHHWHITAGGLLRGYLWFHIIAGWVLTTLWVGGLTKLVKT
jgi:hypothetical protein